MAKPPKRRRGLTPEERRLWQSVAASVTPSSESAVGSNVPRSDDEPRTAPNNLALKTTPDVSPSFPLRPAKASQAPRAISGWQLTPSLEDQRPVGRPEPGLDRRTANRLRKGDRDPDARIDLHGMSAERAHRACLTFLGDSLSRGHRVVLVITGKGGRNATMDTRGKGILRDALPGWLRASPLAPSIVGIYQAHQKHGGAGAYYIYLKRRR